MSHIHYGLSIDPGLSTGVAMFSYSDDEPLTIEEVWQFPLGAEGLSMFLDQQKVAVMRGRGMTPKPLIYGEILSTLVVEKFTPFTGAGRQFELTRDSVEPLRGEGVLIGRHFGPFINWAEPGQQYFMGGEDLAEKKRLSRAFLKKFGMMPSARSAEIYGKDADDAVSATLHAVSFMRRMRHRPTINAMFGEKLLGE